MESTKAKRYAVLDEFSQGQRERLLYLEMHLWFSGAIGRRDLETRFGIKPARRPAIWLRTENWPQRTWNTTRQTAAIGWRRRFILFLNTLPIGFFPGLLKGSAMAWI